MQNSIPSPRFLKFQCKKTDPAFTNNWLMASRFWPICLRPLGQHYASLAAKNCEGALQRATKTLASKRPSHIFYTFTPILGHISLKRNTTTGIVLAVIATMVWSGNFIIARTHSSIVPPITLAFFRWACAALVFFPLGIASFWKQRQLVLQGWLPLACAALFGIALFNTFLYVGGRHSSAINLALISTTSSPIFSMVLARVFLKERVPWHRWMGLGICLVGIVVLISKGQWQTLRHFKFTAGDGWILLAAFSFALYNIFTRKKPATLLPTTYLFVTFWIGAVLLLPGFLWEATNLPAVVWNGNLILVVLYLGVGTSVVAFFCWNAAIARLGAARTALFGNLIPLFSSLEAIWLLNEHLTATHLAGMAIICLGLLAANSKPPRWLAQAAQHRV
ncbi:MAG: DMT family transporter [Bacteroidetes bacterium]|nr:MAG: DMT family transporter [Bacteroidota bacterium]